MTLTIDDVRMNSSSYITTRMPFRFDKYYVVFFLGEGAVMLTGLGYNGRDSEGRVLWY